MKIRKCFVSNSSSSSFIATDDTSMGIFMKIYEHWKIYRQDYLEDGEELSKYELEVRARCDKFIKEHSKDFDGNICFPYSINYETFITKSGGGEYIVETSNNDMFIEAEGLYIMRILEEDFELDTKKETYFNIHNSKTETQNEIMDNFEERYKELDDEGEY